MSGYADMECTTKKPKHCILPPGDICMSHKFASDFCEKETCKKCKYNKQYQRIDFNEISKGTCSGVAIDN